MSDKNEQDSLQLANVEGVSDDQPVAPDQLVVPELELRVKNITKPGLHVLESLLTQWAQWHHQTYQQGYPPELQLLHGSLALDVEQLYQDGVVSWLDKIAPVPGTGRTQAREASNYEQNEAPPQYDRAIGELLAPPITAATGVGMTPGGAEAARRRAAAEACVADVGADAPGAAPAKRRRLPSNRCFNCGSYAHGIAECPKPHDQDHIAAAKAERGAAGGFMASMMRQRYFSQGGKGGKPNPYEGITPGCISPELAAALGMRSHLAPPPWISRMAVLGLPPKYCEAPAGEAAAMLFFMGSEDETAEGEASEDEDAAADGEAAGQAAGSEAAAEGSSRGEDQAADADYLPIGDAAMQAALQDPGRQQERQQQQQQNGHVGEAVAAAAAAVAEDKQAQGSRPHAGTNGVGVQAGGRGKALHPGINAPFPEGADAEAWQAELDKGMYVSRMLGITG